jgi:Isochorismatase family
MSDYAEVRGDYLRRGFASRIGWGARPAVLVVDLTSGFTDPTTPLGADLSDVIAATNRILEISRSAAMPVIFTSIAYGDPVVEGGYWVRKIPALELLKEGSPLVEVDPRLRRRSNGDHQTLRLGIRRHQPARDASDAARRYARALWHLDQRLHQGDCGRRGSIGVPLHRA